MQVDIGELRTRVLALTAEVKSRDVRYRLVEMHERLGVIPATSSSEPGAQDTRPSAAAQCDRSGSA